MALIIKNTANATITNEIITFRKTPTFNVIAPASCAALRVSYGPAALPPSFSKINRFEKSTLPNEAVEKAS